MRYLLDTNICSRLVRGQDVFLARAEGRLWADSAISAITAHELEFWATATGAKRLQAVRDFLSTAVVIPFEAAAAQAAAKLRAALLSKPLSAYDALIAGHALALGYVLVTADADFKRVPGLRTENWLKA
jgi:tRNA(fMet)-specific endonuclease VapC